MEQRDHPARYGRRFLPGDAWARWAFLALLMIAAVLRFWDLPHLPYTHDELSALIRMYPTLGETIRKGVIELDTHPPGVQVLEWVWTKVFSMHEADVKLPFILMGLAAIFLLYRFAMAWYGPGPALLLTVLLATLQYSVMYGQIARPYAAGLFTTALLADQLTRYLAFGDRRMLIGIGVAAVLSAYTHHFALMLAGLMVGTGFFLIDARQRKAYLLMCLLAALLYLPNLPIFFKQLGLGGLDEWLQPPTANWFTDYAWYIAHNSMTLAVLLVAAIAWAIVLTVKHRMRGGAERWFVWVWGFLPLVVGFAYSVWRSPVLQYSVVLFSFPYVALAFIGGLRHAPRVAVLVFTGLVGIVAVHSLVTVRHHYDLFYTSKYEAMLKEGQAAVEDYGKDGALVLLDAPHNVIRFYLNKWGVRDDDFPYVPIRDAMDAGALDSTLRAYPDRVVLYGECNGAGNGNIARVQHYFPYLLQRRDLVDGQVFRFAPTGGPMHWYDRDTVAFVASNGQLRGGWNVPGDLRTEPSVLDSAPVWDYSGREYGVDITIALDSACTDPFDAIEVVAEVEGWTSETNAAVIADVRSGDSTVHYLGGELKPLVRTGRNAVLITTFRPVDVHVKGPLTLKTFVHNRSSAQLRVRSLVILRREANPVQYGTLDPIRWLGRYH